MSLKMFTVAVADFVASAWLVAVIASVAGDGKSRGAVYRPLGVMVPTTAFPAATPFTLQLTPLLFAFVTVAANVAVIPSTTDPLAGETVTTIGGGGGGGGGATGPAPPPAQPSVQAPAVRRAVITILFALKFGSSICGRGRMPSAKQAKGQRKKRNRSLGLGSRHPRQQVRKSQGISKMPYFVAARFGLALHQAFLKPFLSTQICSDLEPGPPDAVPFWDSVSAPTLALTSP